MSKDCYCHYEQAPGYHPELLFQCPACKIKELYSEIDDLKEGVSVSDCEHKEVWSVAIPSGNHVVLCLTCRSITHWCNWNDNHTAQIEADKQQEQRLWLEQKYFEKTGELPDYKLFFEQFRKDDE